MHDPSRVLCAPHFYKVFIHRLLTLRYSHAIIYNANRVSKMERGEFEMATQKQIETLLEELRKASPAEYFQKIDKGSVGIRAILKYLNEISDHATAGEISKVLGVSTARVAVLLKKMVNRGLLEKQGDPSDGRLVVVRLSQSGIETAERFRNELYTQLGNLIDEIGMERMLEFVAISNEIRYAMCSIEQNEYRG